jgi:hypothetical protein
VGLVVPEAGLASLTVGTSMGATLGGTVTFEGPIAPEDRQGVRILAVAVSPAAGAPVVRFQSAISDGGGFAMDGVFGSRVLRAEGLPPGWFLKSVVVGGVDDADAPMDVASRTPGPIQVILSNKSAALTGRVIDRSGSPVKGGTAIVFADEATRWSYPSRFVRLAAVQPNGTFRVAGLPMGRYLVAAARSVDRFWDAPESLGRLRASASPITLAPSVPGTITLKLVP